MFNCIIIVGPTATGKTSLSVKLAQILNGEIINADSQQMIKSLDIGTAKVTSDEMQGIKHHLLNIIEPGQDFSVAEFKERALLKIQEIQNSGKMPIIVGGTGFYVKALLYDYTFGNSSKNDDLRKKYEVLADNHGKDYVYNLLKEVDPESASKISANDLKRVIRALEIFEQSGTKKSSQSLNKNDFINPVIIGLNSSRETLYSRINTRVDIMMKNGLMNEIKLLKDKGLFDDIKLASNLPIGYSEWEQYYKNNMSQDEVVDLIKQDSRHYAKRQLTWFNKMDVKWFDIEKDSFDDILNYIETQKNTK